MNRNLPFLVAGCCSSLIVSPVMLLSLTDSEPEPPRWEYVCTEHETSMQYTYGLKADGSLGFRWAPVTDCVAGTFVCETDPDWVETPNVCHEADKPEGEGEL